MDTPLDTLPKAVETHIDELTGGTAPTLEEALDQWSTERELVKQLNEQNERFEKENTKLLFLARLGKHVIDNLVKDTGLFAKPKTHEKIEKFMDHYTKMQNDIPQLSEPPF